MTDQASDPDQAQAVDQYRDAAPGYDAHMRRFERWQRMAVDRLRLRSGDTVIDVAWDNVELIEAAVEQAHIRTLADAALFSFTHDILQAPAAVANVIRHLRPGARVSSVGAKLAPGWAWPVNLVVRRAARPFVTTFEGLDRPWRELERHLGAMESKTLALGGAYVAWGAVPAEDGDETAPPNRWDRHNRIAD